MEKQELATLLEKLQRELESGPAVDEGLRQSLQSLQSDIQIVLAQQGATASASASSGGDADEGSLNDRAQELEAKFSAEHPYLASTLRDVMDTLGKMGI
jgi:hypothetical protein